MTRRLTNFGRFTPIQRSTSLINKFLMPFTLCTISFLFFLSAFSPLAFAQEKKTSPSTLEELLAKGPDPRWSKIVPLPETLGAKAIPPPIIREVQGPTGPHEVRLQNQKALIFPNIRMHPNPTTTQSEMTIWTHPNNPDVVLAGSNAASNPVTVISQGWYYTTDGGANWIGGDTLPTHTNLGQFMSDPAVGIDLDGNLFFNALLIGGTHEVIMARSTNNGTNWTQVSAPNASTGNDKNHMAIDVNPGGAFENFLYTAFTDFNVAPPNVMFSRSINRGLSFSAPIPINGSVGAQFGQGVNLSVGPGGEVYGAWSGYDAFPTAITHLGFNKSTNGGAAWGTAVSITDVADIRGTLNKGGNIIRCNSFPSMAVDRSGGARNGWIYIVYPAKNPTTPDVFLVRSTNGGSSWSTPLKVNQDVSGKDQWFPWVSCDPATGALYIVYYDSRNFPANDSAQVYISTSLDGGFTFEDVLISDQAFLLAPIPGLAGGYAGDYIGVSAKNGIVWPCWNDNRTGIHQGYTTRAVFIAVGSPPKISVSPDTLDYGNVFLGHPETLTVNIRNLGFPETLSVTNIQSNNSDFTPDVTSFDLPGGNGRGVKVAFNPASAGPSSGTLTILSSDTSNPSVTVALLGTGLIPPDISTAPDSLDADLLTGATKVETLTVSNSGGSNLDFDISVKFSAPLSAAIKPLAVKTIGGRAGSMGSADAGLSVWEANGLDEAAYRQRLPSGPVKNRTEAMLSAATGGTNLNAAFSLNAKLPLIEDFERLDPWPWSPWVPALFASGVISAGCAHDGAQGISEPEWHYRTDVAIGNPDEKLSLWVKPGFGRLYMGFGASAGGAWSLVAGANTGQLIIQENAGYGFSNLASVPQVWTEGTWYKLEITFEEGAAVTGRLYASDGTTLLNTVTATLSGFLPGGVAIRSFSGFCGDTFESGDALNWLAANPDSGAIPAGESLKVEVTFDATGLNGGDYYADIIVSSNDPDEPQDTTPAHLHVTGAPDIALSDDSLDFDSVFTSGSRTETLVVTDPGTDVVMVSSITSDNPNFTVDITSFNLNPGDNQAVLVTFTPVDTGMFTGQLTIVSNDPDEETLFVALQGVGILPPDISVSPESLEADLFTGEVKVETLTIANSGYSDLSFDISLETAALQALKGPNGLPAIRWNPVASRSLTDHPPTTASSQHSAAPKSISRPLVPADFLIIDHFKNKTFFGGYTSVLASEFDLNTLTTADLQQYKVVYCEPDWSSYANLTNNMSKISAYVQSGGVVVLNVGGNIGDGIGIDPLGTNYANYAGGFGGQTHEAETITDPGHSYITGQPFGGALLTTADFNSWGSTDHGHLFNYPGSSHIVLNNTQDASWLEYPLGSGKVIVTTLTYGWGGGGGMGNPLANLINYAFHLSQSSWLSVAPTSGTVPAGFSLDVEVTFDASGLNGGDYNANILVSSNDPDEPQDTTPAHLHVTGAPDIALSDDSLDYGNLFVGGSRPETVVVSNVGTDLLTVSSISSDNANFTPNPTAFSLNPGEDQNVIVTFAPADSGSFSGQLTVASNDPGEPTLTVYLQGRGLLPPDISVSPESLKVELYSGEMKVETLTITNTGYSDLDFDISVKEPQGLAAAAKIRSIFSFEERQNAYLQGAASRSGATTGSTTDHFTSSRTIPKLNLSSTGPNVLIIQNNDPWGIFIIENLLTGLGASVSYATSSSFVGMDLSQFDLIVLPSSQDVGNFYSDIDAHIGLLQSYVSAGGVLEYHATTQGQNALLPGGASSLFSPEQVNLVVAPSHPIVQGVPPTVNGNSASHNHLAGLPGGATVITTGQGGLPTTAEYEIGGGHCIVTGMTWEFAYNIGWDYALMLPNALAYSLSLAGVSWLSVAPTSATIPAGSSLDVEVTFDAVGLDGGYYNANILISSNDPDEPQDTTPVQLHVIGTPNIVLSDDTLDFGTVYINYPDTLTLTVSNDGSDLLEVTGITSNNSLFTLLDPAVFNVPQGGSHNLRVRFSPTQPGVETGALSIASTDSTDPTVTVQLAGLGSLPALVQITPDSFKVTLPMGDSTTRTMTIGNTGLGNLNWLISGLPSYLSVAPAAGVVAPGNTQDVTVKISAKSLPAGNYQTNIRTAANDPTTPLVLTPLSLTVINCTAFKGDINDDGLLTPADVVRELNCIFLSIFGCELCFTDMNCDGRLTAADAVILMNTVFLGLPPGC